MQFLNKSISEVTPDTNSVVLQHPEATAEYEQRSKEPKPHIPALMCSDVGEACKHRSMGIKPKGYKHDSLRDRSQETFRCCLTFTTLLHNSSVEGLQSKVKSETGKRYNRRFQNKDILVGYSLSQDSMESMKWSKQITVGILVIQACTKFLGLLRNQRDPKLLKYIDE